MAIAGNRVIVVVFLAMIVVKVSSDVSNEDHAKNVTDAVVPKIRKMRRDMVPEEYCQNCFKEKPKIVCLRIGCEENGGPLVTNTMNLYEPKVAGTTDQKQQVSNSSLPTSQKTPQRKFANNPLENSGSLIAPRSKSEVQTADIVRSAEDSAADQSIFQNHVVLRQPIGKVNKPKIQKSFGGHFYPHYIRNQQVNRPPHFAQQYEPYFSQRQFYIAP